jgi:prepilin signal peptidase PulO-like enzyme (type II secretory pathway)
MPKEFDADEELKAFENLGITEIWVTPKIPFMIPLLVGFVFAFFPGDLLMQLVRTFM